MVQAGVGMPINEVVWRVSMLNLARRNAEKMVIRKPKNGKMVGSRPKKLLSWAKDFSSKWNISTPGTTPNETISARESSCLPISEYARSKRASMPSIKSSTAAMPMRYAAFTRLPWKAEKIARHPQNRFIQVMAFGKCFFMQEFFDPKRYGFLA